MGVPKHAVNAGLDYNDAKWDAHLDIRGIINRPGPADNVFHVKRTGWRISALTIAYAKMLLYLVVSIISLYTYYGNNLAFVGATLVTGGQVKAPTSV